MLIRRMTEQDLPTILELEQRLFKDPWSSQSFQYELRDNRFSLPLVLEEEGKIIGYAIIWRIYEEFHIANFAIHPDYQGKGYGQIFLKNLFRLAGNCQYAILEVRESNRRAIHIYEKFGFRVIMRRPNYYADGETALVMQKMLKPTRKSPPIPFQPTSEKQNQ